MNFQKNPLLKLVSATLVLPALIILYAPDVVAEPVDQLNMNFVGGNTRLGVGFDSALKSRIDASHIYFSNKERATSAQSWLNFDPTASDHEDKLTGAGLKLNHHWVGEHEEKPYVNKLFAAYDQNVAGDKKLTAGYGQEFEHFFWSGHFSKTVSDERLVGRSTNGHAIYEQAYEYGSGVRTGAFISDHLLRVQGGFDYEWGDMEHTNGNHNNDQASQLSVLAGVEKFFAGSPHSVGAQVALLRKQGGYEDESVDVRGNVNYRYDFASEAGMFQPEERYRRVRVEIPGKTATAEPEMAWRRELISTSPTWVRQALRNTIDYKQHIDTYRSVKATIKDRDEPNSPPDNSTSKPPLAVDDDVNNVIAGQEQILDVLANDSDPEGETVRILAYDTRSVAGATIALLAGKLIYKAPATFAGTDRFNYTIIDSAGHKATATVNLDILD